MSPKLTADQYLLLFDICYSLKNKKQKASLKPLAVLLIFSLEYILSSHTGNTSKQQKMVALLRNVLDTFFV